ncbi:MAG: SagB/ThcOx family dehydrogenase [Chloroflexota bacterium]
MAEHPYSRERSFLKDNVRLSVDFSRTDQSRGVPPPPLEKPCTPEARRIGLPAADEWQGVVRTDLAEAIGQRQSHRRYRDAPLGLDELSFLLWATQGVRARPNSRLALRTVPSAGCRHAFETYIAALNVAGLAAGLYRYLPLENELVLESQPDLLQRRLAEAALGQTFVGNAAATFVWTALPYRMEWRYGGAAHKVIALDAGHVCQNLYLASAAVGCGTCAVAAYHQELMDQLLGVDGEEEFTVYPAPVGKV